MPFGNNVIIFSIVKTWVAGLAILRGGAREVFSRQKYQGQCRCIVLEVLMQMLGYFKNSNYGDFSLTHSPSAVACWVPPPLSLA